MTDPDQRGGEDVGYAVGIMSVSRVAFKHFPERLTPASPGPSMRNE